MSIIPDIQHDGTRTLARFYRDRSTAKVLLHQLRRNQPNVADLHMFEVSADQWREAIYAALEDKIGEIENSDRKSKKELKITTCFAVIAYSILFSTLTTLFLLK